MAFTDLQNPTLTILPRPSPPLPSPSFLDAHEMGRALKVLYSRRGLLEVEEEEKEEEANFQGRRHVRDHSGPLLYDVTRQQQQHTHTHSLLFCFCFISSSSSTFIILFSFFINNSGGGDGGPTWMWCGFSLIAFCCRDSARSCIGLVPDARSPQRREFAAAAVRSRYVIKNSNERSSSWFSRRTSYLEDRMKKKRREKKKEFFFIFFYVPQRNSLAPDWPPHLPLPADVAGLVYSTTPSSNRSNKMQ